MIRVLKIYFYKILIKFFLNFKKSSTIQFNPSELNFRLTTFTDHKKIRTLYFNIGEIKLGLNDDKSFLYHSFEWISLSKKLGGANNIRNANKIIINWINQNKSIHSSLWSTNLISLRFINLVYSLEFLEILFDQNLKNRIYKFLYLHFLLLKNQINNNPKNATISDLKAIFLGSCIYKKGIKNSLKLIDNLLSQQIDSLGFHKSYNALEQAKFINNMHEIKAIFLFFGITENKKLIFQINNMASVMQNLFHQDKSLILFNGSRNTNSKEVNKVLNLSKDIVPKSITSNEEGLVFYKDKQKSIFMDIVKPINQTINKTLHASTLAFELSCKGEKIITNCGSINREIINEDDYLRYSAAHSTIILNNTNISELNRKKSYRRVPDKITFNKQNEKGYIFWSASHNGYINNFNKIVSRKIRINKNTNEINGEDSIISTKMNSKKIIYHIRFHLLPKCNCILTNNKKTVILQSNNQSWMFKTNSVISIEDSIYVNSENKIQQTKQIVISGYVSDKKKIENWTILKHD